MQLLLNTIPKKSRFETSPAHVVFLLNPGTNPEEKHRAMASNQGPATPATMSTWAMRLAGFYSPVDPPERNNKMAMGQTPVPSVNIPIPTKRGSKMSVEFTYQPKWDQPKRSNDHSQLDWVDAPAPSKSGDLPGLSDRQRSLALLVFSETLASIWLSQMEKIKINPAVINSL